jgi:clan AA aspartic protease (TIGR02281 family)
MALKLLLRTALGLFIFSWLACGMCWAGSVIYQWKDEQGRLHFTDNPSAVPVQYWNQISQGSRPSEPMPPTHGRSTRVVVGSGQRAIQVPVSVNRTWTFLAYLDTGATYCQITGEDARILGISLESQPKVKVTMADGRSLEAPVVTLESVRIGSVELKEVEALVGDLRLLGLNALRQLRLTVDLPNGEVVLEAEKR